MALIKKIEEEDTGTILNYHRIQDVSSIINSHISIVVFSYVSEKARELETKGKMPYKRVKTYELGYKENITIEECYNYLKTLDEFKDATDD